MLRSTLLGVMLGLVWLSMALAALGWLLTWAAPILAASAPRPKPKVRPPIAGSWVLVQNGQRYEATFYKDGVWACRSAGPGWGGWWVGRWEMKGDRLECTEQYHVDGQPAWHETRWVAELEPGTLTGSYLIRREGCEARAEPFALERAAAAR